MIVVWDKNKERTLFGFSNIEEIPVHLVNTCNYIINNVSN